MTRRQCIQAFLAMLFFALSPSNAKADGGVVRLREADGPFVVTVFSGPQPSRDTSTDVSIMVQGRESGEAILDAAVDLIFTAPQAHPAESQEQICGPTHTTGFTVPATRDKASNKLLYAASVNFGAAGIWKLQARVERGNDAAHFACDIPVGLPPRSLAGLVPNLALPPLVIVAFAINQWLRAKSVKQ